MSVKRPRLLDLFCKAGGAAVGYWRAGYDVVGVDIEPQPHYPFAFWQGDALEVLRGIRHGDFDAIHASPPCKAFTPLASMANVPEHPDLLTPCRTALDETGIPYIIENVPGAPMRADLVLCGSMFGLGLNDGSAQLRRHRLFELRGRPLILRPPCNHDRRPRETTIRHGASYGLPRTVTVAGNSGGSSKRDNLVAHNHEQRQEAMGIDWMTAGELSQAIPPAYTEFIGRQLLQRIAITP